MSSADGVGVDTQRKAWGVAREVMSYLASAITGISSRAWDPSWVRPQYYKLIEQVFSPFSYCLLSETKRRF